MDRFRQSLPEPIWGTVSLITLVVVPFLGMLFFEATRWNIVAELWGVVGAGALFWYFTEQRSENIQRKAWLRRNRTYVRAVIERVLLNAALVMHYTLGAPDDLYNDLIRGKTREVRRRAAQKIRVLVAEVDQGKPRRLHGQMGLDECISQGQFGLEKVMIESSDVFGRLTDLHAVTRLCVERCRWVAIFDPTLREVKPAGGLARWLQTGLPADAGEAALVVCEVCADILVEAGELATR